MLLPPLCSTLFSSSLLFSSVVLPLLSLRVALPVFNLCASLSRFLLPLALVFCNTNNFTFSCALCHDALLRSRFTALHRTAPHYTDIFAFLHHFLVSECASSFAPHLLLLLRHHIPLPTYRFASPHHSLQVRLHHHQLFQSAAQHCQQIISSSLFSRFQQSTAASQHQQRLSFASRTVNFDLQLSSPLCYHVFCHANPNDVLVIEWLCV